MLNPLQIRAARAMLGMSQKDLAQRSDVGLATLKRIEAAGLEFSGTARTLVRIQRTLEVAGVVFLDQTLTAGPGVRMSQPID